MRPEDIPVCVYDSAGNGCETDAGSFYAATGFHTNSGAVLNVQTIAYCLGTKAKTRKAAGDFVNKAYNAGRLDGYVTRIQDGDGRSMYIAYPSSASLYAQQAVINRTTNLWQGGATLVGSGYTDVSPCR